MGEVMGDVVEWDALARERHRLIALTLVAALDAIILALISLQFLAPPALIALICVAPALFSLEALWAPLGITLESGALVVVVAAALYGPVIGVWTCAYVLLGLLYGLGRIARLPAALRVVGLALAMLTLVAGAFVALLWLGGLSLPTSLVFVAQWTTAVTSRVTSSVVGVALTLGVAGALIATLLAAILIEIFAQTLTRRVAFDTLMRETEA